MDLPFFLPSFPLNFFPAFFLFLSFFFPSLLSLYFSLSSSFPPSLPSFLFLSFLLPPIFPSSLLSLPLSLSPSLSPSLPSFSLPLSLSLSLHLPHRRVEKLAHDMWSHPTESSSPSWVPIMIIIQLLPSCQPLKHWCSLVTFIKLPLFKVLNILQVRELIWGAGTATPRDKWDVEPSSILLIPEVQWWEGDG